MKDRIKENGITCKLVGDYYVQMMFNDLVLMGRLWICVGKNNKNKHK